jgi:hypothetical protein
MDALSAFSLAAGILQVISFASEIIKTGKQIYDLGKASGNAELEAVSRDFVFVTAGLKQSITSAPDPLTVDESVRNLLMRRSRDCMSLD